MKYLLEHNIDDADTYLTNKGFSYHTTDSEGSCESMFWSYNRDISNNNAISFIAKNCFEANWGFIWYQFGEKLTLESIKKDCKSLGFIFKNTEINKFGDLCTTYIGTKYKIEFCSGVDKETNLNEYIITLRFK